MKSLSSGQYCPIGIGPALISEILTDLNSIIKTFNSILPSMSARAIQLLFHTKVVIYLITGCLQTVNTTVLYSLTN